MTQLTKNQIIELITAPICKNSKLSLKSSKLTSEEILNSLEKAGVLMLVDDEPKEGDLVFTNIPSYYGEISIIDNVNARIKNNTISPLTDFYKVDLKIIQRNNTPVYQYRKGVTND